MGVYDKVRAQMSSRGSGNGDLFVKLADNGAKVVGVFRGEPFIREVFWNGERYEEKTDTTPTEQRTTLRIAQNIAVLDDGNWTSKIIEQSQRFFQGVMTVDEKYGIDEWSFEVVRKGSAGDTNTTYAILPESALNDEQKKSIASLDLFDLERVLTVGETAITPNIPDNEAIDSVIRILKDQSKEIVTDFLKKFGVKKIRDIQVHQMEEVTKHLESLTGGQTDDPFA